ncbi:hypothetical protein SODALDRAFT_353470 [Sodiomyces alkalinus F11]|uniref:Ribonuclease H1 N-terminal domain-containing protein n=1 Tax=Sodiomyces alkalinus (strain CBS 110278 / VKM F-3762 / F11) TaxID=1314773 RepID=A0A3N2PKW7_SODAK|nr:hypothetical protein SODALDRAFT_353470 [Sodiomyces alkalinus F11]ROT35054.1 hypothetical protein SODALDRAFT_353470 [Sodiomyces alkalinus F11]
MPNNKKKNFYAVSKGLFAPAICSSWAHAQRLVTGYSEAQFKGFAAYDDARYYLKDHGHEDFLFISAVPSETKDIRSDVLHAHFLSSGPSRRGPKFYAVANGQNPGVYSAYGGDAREQVDKFSGACYKAFSTQENAQQFIDLYNDLHNSVVEVRIPIRPEKTTM